MKNYYPLIFNQPSYKLPHFPLFLQRKSSLCIRPHLKIFILTKGGGRGANYGFIYRNKYPPIHFIFTTHPAFAIFPQGYFIMTPPPPLPPTPSLWKFRKIPPTYLISWCGNFVERQFPHSFGRFARNSSETVPFHKNYTPGD